MKRARRHLPKPVLEAFQDTRLGGTLHFNLMQDAARIESVANPKNTEVRSIVKALRASAAFYQRVAQER